MRGTAPAVTGSGTLRRALVLAAVIASLVAMVAVPDLRDVGLHLGPAGLLLLPLLLRRYVGEQRLARLVRSVARRRRRRTPVVVAAVRRRPVARMVRGGRLVGSGLSVRPPPVALAG